MAAGRVKWGIFLIALTTLMIELVLIRIFDVILSPNMGYMVITTALFAFGLGGLYRSIKPVSTETKHVRNLISLYALLFGIFCIGIYPIIDNLPFDFNELTVEPVNQSLFFLGIYLSMVVPFYFAGLVFTTVFSHYSEQIQSLYFWDLVGAGLGTLIIIPLLPRIGPAGILMVAAAIAIVAAAIFSEKKTQSSILLIVALAVVAVPLVQYPDIFDFQGHVNKRGVLDARAAGKIEISRWDPISKIDIIDDDWHTTTIPGEAELYRKHVAYDGGNQSSFFFPFDGDIEKLRGEVEAGVFGETKDVHRHWWRWGVLASHYLKRDQDQDVLIIGSAGGQETVAALVFGAGNIDAIELVGTVVDLARGMYSDYIGNIFKDSRVNLRTDEGRSFLRSGNKEYDIIQIYSNHTSSSIASGTGAMATTYLQTVEAYQEYFEHLGTDGILHINHHIFPRMIATASVAWEKMGRSDFRKHVVVYQRSTGADNIPTMLIKMTPWTKGEMNEIAALQSLFHAEGKDILMADPLNSESSFLTDDFFSGNLPQEIMDSTPYRIRAATDDRPYFNFLRKSFNLLELDKEHFVDNGTVAVLNSQMRQFVAMDVVHLFLTGIACVLFAAIFVLLPLLFSNVGKVYWQAKQATLLYFSCLGAGFIILELVFTQIFMRLIGYPLYAFSTVIFVLLLSAGLGSMFSEKLSINPVTKWYVPFIGIAITVLGFSMVYPYVFEFGLQFELLGRILISSLLIFPVGFFLGMPFPLGILAIKDMPQGAVAWAWSMNSLFTVIGGLGSVLLSIFIGFNLTLLTALAIYAVGFLAFIQLRKGMSLSNNG